MPERSGEPSIDETKLSGQFQKIVLHAILSDVERARPVEVRRSLLLTICGRASNVAMVALAMALCGLAAWFRDGNYEASTVALIGFLIYVVRCRTIMKVGRLINANIPIDPDLWLVRFSRTALAASICWGVLTVLAVVNVNDSVVATITIIANVGSAGAVAARNTGIPRLAKLMLSAALIPLMIGTILAEDRGYLLLLVLVPTLMAGLFVLIDERSQQMVDLIITHKKLSDLSNTDPLTQISNRRHFFDRMEQAKKAFVKLRKPISVIMIDVDYFKAFNDHYGHPMGDVCLQEIAATLLINTRSPGDVVSRYGGEEFAVLLADTGLAEALVIAERLRKAVATLPRRHDNRPDRLGTTTISVGAASTDQQIDVAHLMEAADEALYHAKRRGRNQVVPQAVEDVEDEVRACA